MSLESQVSYYNSFSEWSNAGSLKDSFLIFDNKLLDYLNTNFFIESFPNRYGVQSGEDLKNINNFPKHISNIVNQTSSLLIKASSLVVLGGGSVGDFGGFVASTLKRGIDLIAVPTTWLAAIDSSHGGKNALNVDGHKNQIGTFYAAKEVIIIKEILDTNNKSLETQAWGEAIKILLINNKLQRDGNLWNLLPSLVSEKYAWVAKDPLEAKGERKVLNFGHTLGHIVEARGEVAHGWAVGQGLHFSLRWSQVLNNIDLSNEISLLESKIPFQKKQNGNDLAKLSEKVFIDSLLQDKKRVSSDNIDFVFLDKNKKPAVVSTAIKDIIKEATRQKWIV